MISIEGLTAKQKTLMDIMWAMDDMAKVQTFVNSLPRLDRIDAQGLIQIAVWESIEQAQGLEEYEDAAIAVIRGCM